MNVIRGKITKQFRRLLCTAVLLSAVPLATQAAFHGFGASLDPSQEVPPVVGSIGTGLGFFVFDDVTKILTWDISFTGLTGPIHTVASGLPTAHIHSDPGGSIEIFLDTTNPDTIMSGEGLSAGRFIGSTTTVPMTPAQEALLFAGGLYVNLHTTFAPTGEIRGQILSTVLVPIPAATWMLGSALFTMLGVRRFA